MDDILTQQFRPLNSRLRWRRIGFSLAITWLALAFVLWCVGQFEGGLLWPLGFNWDRSQAVLAGAIAGATLSVVTVLVALFWRPSIARTAALVEAKFPDLNSKLTTAIEQRPQTDQRYSFLQQEVLRQTFAHSLRHDWIRAVPFWQTLAAPACSLIALGLLLMVAWNGLHAPAPIRPLVTAFEEAEIDVSKMEIQVEPGSTEVERGTGQLILARFPAAVPPTAILSIIRADGQTQSLPMQKSLDDPMFAARISSVDQALRYQIKYVDRNTPEFEISVFDYPQLVRADAKLTYPSYTNLGEKILPDVRRLAAVEGTLIELTVFTNKPLTSARLRPWRNRAGSLDDAPNHRWPENLDLAANEPADEPDGEASSQTDDLWLAQDPDDGQRFTVTIPLTQTVQFELLLQDAEGRDNRLPPRFTFTALKNLPPDLKLTLPARDLEVSALEELQLSANAWDDYGIGQVGISYSVAGATPRDDGDTTAEVVLHRTIAAKTRQQVDHLLALETLAAAPDQLVSYYFWAEDIGPDGEIRRTASDMFFAEVRRFDEIFRQGQQPTASQMQQQNPGQAGEGQGAEQAAELAQLQKEIIAATWKIMRRQNGNSLSDAYTDDVQVVGESQSLAISQLDQAAQAIQDAQSQDLLQSARQAMVQAQLKLTAAQAAEDTRAAATQLQDALSQEQLAYQGLLRLRSRESEVVRQQENQQQASQQGGQGNSRSQQQMQQLNLQDDENRYEEQKQAQPESAQSQSDREDRQVLNRLKELARRQEDLNQRLKELQSALEEAQSEEERAEIERRLKSLEEQQQEMLRDTDELIDRMQQEQNQQRMSEQAEQLQQTRENLQQASEALQQGQVSTAAAEGTRAERKLDELKEEFQNRTAGQFDQQMQSLRNQARDLQREQQQLDQQMAEPSSSATEQVNSASGDAITAAPPSLQDDEADAAERPADLVRRLQEQKRQVESLREEMQQTIEEAETLEPLLAQDLYDTYRKSEIDRPDLQLDSASRALRRGWDEEARFNSQQAAEGIQRLGEGIESAAEKVLGDETKALEAARKTLEELNRQVQQELQANASENENATEQDANLEQAAESGRADAGNSSSGQPKRETADPDPTDPASETKRNSPTRNGQPEGGEPEGVQTEGGETEGSQANGDAEVGQGGQGGQGGQRDERESSQESGDADSEEARSTPRSLQSLEEDTPQPNQPNAQREGAGGRSNPGTSDPIERRDQPQSEDRDGGEFSPTQNRGDGNVPMRSPITGDDYLEWSDQLRDVEEMIGDPDLRAEAARIREEARQIRRDIKRHSAEPNWELIRLQVSQPLRELQSRVSEEILRRTSDRSLVPLDRDPVPSEFQDDVRRYYQRLGIGQ